MMESRELDRRRGWPWTRKNLSGLISSGSEGGSSPAPVKLFDEQEVARILEDQVRNGDEQMVEALHVADLKYAEKEKAWSEKLTAANEKLTSALAEITIKDNLVKQHIKVAEEAVVGWEKAENEAAEFKIELENVTKQKRETEDRAKHLDGALKEIMQQLRGGREEHEQHLHDTIVKKTREFDKLRLDMEAKLSGSAKSLSEIRTRLIESQAENEALNHALNDRSRMIAELNDIRAHTETDSKILRVRLEGLEKENFDIKYKVHSIIKELEIRCAELEYGKKTFDVLSRHHAESVKKIVRLEDERNRLRVMVRKKLPNPAAIVRMKQELDALGKETGDSGRLRRRSLNRSHSGGGDFLPVHEMLQDHDCREAEYAQRIANMEEEIRMLKEALAKRNDELQQARIMCAKTASRLTAVEEELETLRSAASLEIRHNDDACSTSSASVWEGAASKDKVVDTEQIRHSLSQSRLSFHDAQDTVTAELESSADAAKTRDLEVANQMCEELSVKLTAAENQLVAMESRNAANEQFVITLQERLDKLLMSQEKADEQIPEAEVYEPETPEVSLELATAVKSLLQTTEALAQALEIRFSPEDASTGSIAKSFHWQDSQLENSMSGLARVGNRLLKGQAHPASFVSELSFTLACITGLSTVFNKDHEAVGMHLESARTHVSQLEAALCKLQEERVEVEIQMTTQLDRVSKEMEQLQKEKVEIMQHVAAMEPQLLEAFERIDTLKEQVKEAEVLVDELRLQLDQQKQEDDLLEQELLDLSASHKNMHVAEAEMNELYAKLAALENELHGERRRHHDVVAKLEDLQEQIHRGVGRDTEAASGRSMKLSQPLIRENDASNCARQEREISAAALAECQRTILALGKQLKILGFVSPPVLDATADSPDSIKQMTETMELLRWRTESGDQSLVPFHKASSSVMSDYSSCWDEAAIPAAAPHPECSTYYRQQTRSGGPAIEGPVSVPASPARSDLEAPSTPESPAMARSVRTLRSFQLPSAPSNSEVILSQSLDLQSGSSYTKLSYFARSLNQTTVSFENSPSSENP